MPQNILDDAIVQRNIENRWHSSDHFSSSLFAFIGYIINWDKWVYTCIQPILSHGFNRNFFFFWMKFVYRVHTENFLENNSNLTFQWTKLNENVWEFLWFFVKILLTLSYKQHKHVHTTMLVSSEKNDSHWQKWNVNESVRLGKIDIRYGYIHTFCDVPHRINVIHIVHGIHVYLATFSHNFDYFFLQRWEKEGLCVV